MDSLKMKAGSYGVLLAAAGDEKVNFVAAVSDDLIAKGLKAGDWVREAAKAAGGGGGGRPQMAMAGGKDVGKISEALEVGRAFAKLKLTSVLLAAIFWACAAAANVVNAAEPIAPAYSWQQPHAKVLPTGNLEWAPKPFVFEKGASVRYIDFDAGDDAKDGRTQQTAWKHHPWDANATGAAKASNGVRHVRLQGRRRLSRCAEGRRIGHRRTIPSASPAIPTGARGRPQSTAPRRSRADGKRPAPPKPPASRSRTRSGTSTSARTTIRIPSARNSPPCGRSTATKSSACTSPANPTTTSPIRTIR